MVDAELRFVLPDDSERVSGGNVYNAELLGALRTLEPALGVPRTRTVELEAFRRQLASGEPGLYFVDTLNLRDALALSTRRTGQRAVLVVHQLPSLEPDVTPGDPALALERMALPLFDAFLATSPFTADLLARRGFPRERIMTVEPGLPSVELGPEAYEPPLRALVVGNLIRRKGVLEVLEAIATTALPKDQLHIDLVGRADLDPGYAEAVQRLITGATELEGRVTFHGPVPYRAMQGHYRRASLLLSAASMETFGMALAEARAHGLPILAFDGGHVRRHFTNGDNGRLFDSVSGLAAGLLGLVRDPAAMRSLFAAARRTASPGGDTWALAARRFCDELSRCFG